MQPMNRVQILVLSVIFLNLDSGPFFYLENEVLYLTSVNSKQSEDNFSLSLSIYIYI